MKDGVLLQLATISHRDVSLDPAENHDGTRFDIANDLGIFSNGEIPFGVHLTFDTTVNDEIVGEAKLSLDLNIAGKNVLAPRQGAWKGRTEFRLGRVGGRVARFDVAGFRVFVLVDDLFKHG